MGIHYMDVFSWCALFYITVIKLWFTGVTMIFHIFAYNILDYSNDMCVCGGGGCVGGCGW